MFIFADWRNKNAWKVEHRQMSQTTFFLTTGTTGNRNSVHRFTSTVDVNLWTEFPFEPSKEQSVSDRAPVDFIRGFRNPEIFLVESGILGFEILSTAQGILNPAMIRIQESKFLCQGSGIHSDEPRIQDCLGLPYIVVVQHSKAMFCLTGIFNTSRLSSNLYLAKYV